MDGDGFYELCTEDTCDVPVRMFLTRRLLQDAEDILHRQGVNTTRFPWSQDFGVSPPMFTTTMIVES